MTTHEYCNLRINRVDTIAAQQSGLPALFYTIKRCYGDDEASNCLRDYEKMRKSLSIGLFVVGGNVTCFQREESVLSTLLS